MQYNFPQVSACLYVPTNVSAFPLNRKSRPHLRNIRPLDLILNKVMFFYSLATYFYEIHFNIMFPTILCCLSYSVPFVTFDRIFLIFFNLSQACPAIPLSFLSWNYSSNYWLWRFLSVRHWLLSCARLTQLVPSYTHIYKINFNILLFTSRKGALLLRFPS